MQMTIPKSNGLFNAPWSVNIDMYLSGLHNVFFSLQQEGDAICLHVSLSDIAIALQSVLKP